jgi:hypothetical protein
MINLISIKSTFKKLENKALVWGVLSKLFYAH